MLPSAVNVDTRLPAVTFLPITCIIYIILAEHLTFKNRASYI